MIDASNLTGMEEPLGREAWDWVLHVTSGHATQGDLAALECWCARSGRHAEAYAQASRRWRSFGPAIAAVQQQDDGRTAAAGRTVARRALLGGALAASAAGIAALVVRPPL